MKAWLLGAQFVVCGHKSEGLTTNLHVADHGLCRWVVAATALFQDSFPALRVRLHLPSPIRSLVVISAGCTRHNTCRQPASPHAFIWVQGIPCPPTCFCRPHRNQPTPAACARASCPAQRRCIAAHDDGETRIMMHQRRLTTHEHDLYLASSLTVFSHVSDEMSLHA